MTCYRGLESDTHKFKEYFVEETAGIPVLAKCVALLTDRCGKCFDKVTKCNALHICSCDVCWLSVLHC